ncbi:unnamed protein product [Anisakis simplex]|uniref:Uncharacterized protein n=1 Tax=Anisakis simplex TaxID=6269 RepID=A0A3P6Q227_ANISI|nr:unnamed protein product [Anisakis simplex]
MVLDDDERKVTFNELSSYAVGLFVLLVVYATYNVFEIYVTYKYQRNINPPSEFSLVSQTDHLYPDLSPAHALSRDQQASVNKATQRPPPYNPNYGPAPPYKL